MITAEEARVKAQAWVGAGGTAFGMHEFDLGWVVWPEADRSADRSRPPARIGDARGVIDRETGELVVYPPLPATEVARRHGWRRQAYERFPPDVADALLNAGWHPGRRLPDDGLDAFAARVRVMGFDLHDAARTALVEFGGLRLSGRSTPRPRDDGTLPEPVVVTISLTPDEEVVGWQLVDELPEDLELPVCPLGTVRPHQDEELAIDSTGRVFSTSAYTGDAYLVAESIDAALVSLVRVSRWVDGSAWLVVPGGLLAEVSLGGTPGIELTGRYRDRAGHVVEPGAPGG